MAADLGQAVVIDNRPGGNGFIAITAAKAAAADGTPWCRWMIHMALLPHLYKIFPTN